VITSLVTALMTVGVQALWDQWERDQPAHGLTLIADPMGWVRDTDPNTLAGMSGLALRMVVRNDSDRALEISSLSFTIGNRTYPVTFDTPSENCQGKPVPISRGEVVPMSTFVHGLTSSDLQKDLTEQLDATYTLIDATGTQWPMGISPKGSVDASTSAELDKLDLQCRAGTSSLGVLTRQVGDAVGG
jgi:hypothetical protein